MNDLLKAKYYKLIKNKNFDQYEKVGQTLTLLEDKIILSSNKIEKEKLIVLLEPLKELETDVYDEIVKDINSGLIYGGSNNGQ